jgi:hypothetical protein
MIKHVPKQMHYSNMKLDIARLCLLFSIARVIMRALQMAEQVLL